MRQRLAGLAGLLLMLATAAMAQEPSDAPGQSIAGTSLVALDEATSECLDLEKPEELGTMSDKCATVSLPRQLQDRVRGQT